MQESFINWLSDFLAMMTLKNVGKTYQLKSGPVHALRDISLQLKDGTFVAIVGSSGSGKSTLMSLLGCLDIPTAGTIEIDGVLTSNYSENDLALLRGKKVGFVFQKFNLIPTLSAEQNVMLPLIFQDVPAAERKRRARELLGFVGLAQRREHRPPQLSGGEQQRVAIARDLINDPEIILADEPTGNLDPVSREMVMELFKSLHKRGKTIIFVTHDHSLKKYAQKVILLKDGAVIGG